jgi:hypothetical protein
MKILKENILQTLRTGLQDENDLQGDQDDDSQGEQDDDSQDA